MGASLKVLHIVTIFKRLCVKEDLSSITDYSGLALSQHSKESKKDKGIRVSANKQRNSLEIHSESWMALKRESQGLYCHRPRSLSKNQGHFLPFCFEVWNKKYQR